MATFATGMQPVEESREKGLKTGALGLASSVVIGVASTAPAYSLAATLFFVVAAVGLKSPLVAVLAFVPMLLCSIGFSELNKADPDCGTTFIWSTRAFGPAIGWAGGWATVAADILVMGSLAQVAGQYGFFLFQGPNSSIGANASGGWVLLVGILWIVAMTYICYRGIELSARFQRVLLTIEVVMLMVLSVTALVKVFVSKPAGSLHPSLSWLSPSGLTLSAFVSGIILMLFIYWGWDTALSVNEETADKSRIPGRAGIISTVLLLFTYGIVIVAVQSFAGVGAKGVGLTNPDHQFDVLSVTGSAIFGTSGFGAVLSRLLILMVLSSAAASTQTTILPAARTTLSMAAYRALPQQFAKISPRYLTPTVSTIVVGVASVALYIPLNFIAGGNPIADAVSAIGLYIAFYYGLTAFCLRLVLPVHGDEQRPRPVDARHPAGARRPDHVLGWSLQPAKRLGGVQQLHQLDGAWPALADRRDLHHRRAGRAGRHSQLCLHARHRPRLLPQADPHQVHPRADP